MTSKHNRQRKRNQARTEKGIFESIKVSKEVKKKVDKEFDEINQTHFPKLIPLEKQGIKHWQTPTGATVSNYDYSHLSTEQQNQCTPIYREP